MSHACGLVNLFEIGPGQTALSQYPTLVQAHWHSLASVVVPVAFSNFVRVRDFDRVDSQAIDHRLTQPRPHNRTLSRSLIVSKMLHRLDPGRSLC